MLAQVTTKALPYQSRPYIRRVICKIQKQFFLDIDLDVV